MPHPLDELSQQPLFASLAGPTGLTNGPGAQNGRARRLALSAMSTGEDPTFDSIMASLQGEDTPAPESEFPDDRLEKIISSLQGAPPDAVADISSKSQVPATDPEVDSIVSSLGGNVGALPEGEAPTPLAGEVDSSLLSGVFPADVARVAGVAPGGSIDAIADSDPELTNEVDDFYATIEAAALATTEPPKGMPGHAWDAVKRLIAPFARYPAEIGAHLKRVRGKPMLDDLERATVRAEVSHRLGRGLYSSDEVVDATPDTVPTQYKPPGQFAEAQSESKLTLSSGRNVWHEKLAERVTSELHRGMPMTGVEARQFQERYYREAAKFNPLNLPKADNPLEKAADFTGEIVRFIAEIELFKVGTKRAVGRLAPDMSSQAQRFLATTGAAGISGALQSPEDPVTGAAHSAAFLALFQAAGAGGRALGGAKGQLAAEMASFGGAEVIAGQPLDRVLIATVLGPLIFRAPKAAGSALRRLGVLRQSKVQAQSEHDQAVERLLMRSVRIATEKSEASPEDLVALRSEAGGIDVEKLSEPYRLAFETFVQENAVSQSEAALEAQRPLEEPGPARVLPETTDAIAEGLKPRGDQPQPRPAREGRIPEQPGVGDRIGQGREVARPDEPAGSETPSAPEPPTEAEALTARQRAVAAIAEPQAGSEAKIERFRLAGERRRTGTQRQPPDPAQADMLDGFADAAEGDYLPAILRRITTPTQALDVMRDIEGEQKSRINRRASLERAGITLDNIKAARQAMADVTEAARRVEAPSPPPPKAPLAERIAEAERAVSSASDAVTKLEARRNYDKVPRTINAREALERAKIADPEYQTLIDAQETAKRTLSGLKAAESRELTAEARRIALEAIAGGDVTEGNVRFAPVDDMPEPLRAAIQGEAEALLAKAKPGSPTAIALDKIVQGSGDTGAVVEGQKQRIIDLLQSHRDDRTIFERQIGAPEREADPMIEAMLAPDRVQIARDAIASIDAGAENDFARRIEERILFSDPEINPLAETTDYRGQARDLFADVLRRAGEEPPVVPEVGVEGAPAAKVPREVAERPPRTAEGLRTPPDVERADLFGGERVPDRPETTAQRELGFTHDVDGNLVTQGGRLTPEGKLNPDTKSETARAEAKRIETEVDQGQMLLGEEPPERAPGEAYPETMSADEKAALDRMDPDDPNFGMGAMFNYPRTEQGLIRSMWKRFDARTRERWQAGFDWLGEKIKGTDPDSRQRRFADWLGRGLWRQMYGADPGQQKGLRRVEGARAEGVVQSRAILEPFYNDVQQAARMAGRTKGEVAYQNAIRQVARGNRPPDSLARSQRKHYENYKKVINDVTDRLLSLVEHEPWYNDILKSYGVENIVDVIKARRELGLPYLRERYRVPQRVEEAAQRQGGQVMMGPRLATSMFKPRGTDLFRVELKGKKGEAAKTWEYYDWDEAAQKFMDLRVEHGEKRVKMRTPFEEDVIAALEPVTDVGYLMMRSITDTLQNVSVLELFRSVEPLASDTRLPGYATEPLPKLGVFGPLAGKYLPRNIARTFTETVDAASNEWVDIGRMLLYFWKFSKTVASPSTNARNWYGNRIFMYLAGASPEAHPRLFADAWREVYKSEVKNDTSETDFMHLVRQGSMTITFAQEAAAPITERMGARGMSVGFLDAQAKAAPEAPVEQTPFERLHIMAKYLENRRSMGQRAALRHTDGDVADDSIFIDAAKQMMSNGPEYKLLARKGLIDSTRPVGVFQTLANVVSKDTAKRDQAVARIMDASQKAGRVYDFSDKVSKVFVYKVMRQQGLSEEQARRKVDYLPNYAMLGTFGKAIRRAWWGAPFISFVDHSVKASFQSARDAPLRLATLYSLPAGMTAITAALYGLSWDDVQSIYSAKGIQGFSERYFQPLIPWQVDGRDAPGLLDLRWIWPLANDFRVATGKGGVTLPFALQMPHVQFAFGDLAHRFNLRTGRPVFEEDDPIPVKMAKAFWHNLMPLPGAINYGAMQAYRSVIGESERSLISVFMQHTLGIRVSPAQSSRRGALNMLREHGREKDANQLFRALDLYNRVLKRKDGKAILLSDLQADPLG